MEKRRETESVFASHVDALRAVELVDTLHVNRYTSVLVIGKPFYHDSNIQTLKRFSSSLVVHQERTITSSFVRSHGFDRVVVNIDSIMNNSKYSFKEYVKMLSRVTNANGLVCVVNQHGTAHVGNTQLAEYVEAKFYPGSNVWSVNNSHNDFYLIQFNTKNRE